MARQRRPGQNPRPRVQNGQWKISYWADIVEGDEHRRVRRTACLGPAQSITFTEACQKARQVLQPINDLAPGVEFREKTLSKLVEEWRAAVKPTLRFSTQLAYEWAVKRIEPAFGAMPVADVEKADVQRFLTESARQLAPKSVRELRGYLRGLLSVAIDWGWLGGNPAAGRMKLPARRTVREKVILTPGQFWALVRELEPPHSTLVIVAVLTGLRRGELSALRQEDFTGDALLVDESCYRGVLGEPKTQRSRRRVKLWPLAQAALTEWVQRCRFRGPRDFLFATRVNVPVDLHNVVARHIKPACRRAGIPLVSWHDFRHTFTTWGRRQGANPEDLRDALGHSSVDVTLNIYSHLDDGAACAAVEQYARSGWGLGVPNGVPCGNEYRVTV